MEKRKRADYNTQVIAQHKGGSEEFDELKDAIEYLRDKGGKIVIPPGYKVKNKSIVEIPKAIATPGTPDAVCYGAIDRPETDDEPAKITVMCFPSESARDNWLTQGGRRRKLLDDDPILGRVDLKPYSSITLKSNIPKELKEAGKEEMKKLVEEMEAQPATLPEEPEEPEAPEEPVEPAPAPPKKAKKRGRPKGAKNKSQK